MCPDVGWPGSAVSVPYCPVSVWWIISRDRRSLQDVTEIGGEVDKRSGDARVKDNSTAAVVRGGQEAQRNPKRRGDGSVLVRARHVRQGDGLAVADDGELKSTIGTDRSAEPPHESLQRSLEQASVEAAAVGKFAEVAEQRCGDLHSVAPRKRIRPLIVYYAFWLSKSPAPMAAAVRTRVGAAASD